MSAKPSVGRAVGGTLGRQLAPRISELAPGLTTAFVREALQRAISGVGPLPPAASAAAKQLREHRGDVDGAIHDVIENHVRYAGAQGFVTNLGGLATMAVAIPTNITGLALVECRMIAGIAHLRGYELDDPRVRNAILVCLLGEDAVPRLVKAKKIPAPPMAMATAPAHDPDLDQIISAEVAADLISRIAGKRLAGTVGRRIPLVGGLVGAGADGYATWKIGRYADRELLPLARR
jgi:EcsC protein family